MGGSSAASCRTVPSTCDQKDRSMTLNLVELEVTAPPELRRRFVWRRLRVDCQVICRALYSSLSVVSIVAGEGDDEEEEEESLVLVLCMRLE